MKYVIIILCIWLVKIPNGLAKVELLVEPYMGFSQLTLDTGESTIKETAGVLGGKGGFFKNNFGLLLDFHFGGPYLLEDNDNEYTNYMWGLGLLYAGKKARIYLGYGFRNTLEDVERNFKYLGTGLKLTFGVTFESKLSINIEILEYDFSQSQSGSNNNTNVSDFSAGVAMFSISAPLLLK